MQLTNKTIIIPGASRPIGRQLARRFAVEGAKLVLPYYDWPESVAEMIEEFTESGATFIAEQCDLRKRNQVDQLVAQVVAQFGSIDYLVNNIERGGMPVVHGSYEQEHNIEQWQVEFDTTLKAKWNLFNSILPYLKETGGSVVNLSSIAAHTGRSGPAACFFNDGYSAANRGIQLLTETWARQGAPGVRVNEIMLGLIESRHGKNTRGWTALTTDEKQSLTNHTLLDRQGSPEEVADLVYFILVKATYMTGTVIPMDGGYILGKDHVPPMPPGIL